MTALIAFLEWLLAVLWAWMTSGQVWAQPIGPVIPILEFLAR